MKSGNWVIDPINDNNGNRGGGLMISSLLVAQNPKLLKQYQITAILSMLKLSKFINIKNENPNIVHEICQVDDMEDDDISIYFDSTYNFIEKYIESGNVLVHCLAGVSRSSTIVINYLMRKYKWRYDKAYEYVKQKRNCVRPNEGFIEQLKRQQQKIFSKKF